MIGVISRYAIYMLLVIGAGVAYGLWTSIEANGALKEELKQVKQEAIGANEVAKAYKLQTASIAESFTSLLKEQEDARRLAEKKQQEAQSRANKARLVLDNIQRTGCYDTSLDSGTVDILRSAIKAFSGDMPTSSSVSSSESTSASTMAPVTCRAIVYWTLKLAERFEQCNNLLVSN